MYCGVSTKRQRFHFTDMAGMRQGTSTDSKDIMTKKALMYMVDRS